MSGSWWLNLRVSGDADWPREDRWVQFDGRQLLLRPRTREYCASIHTEYPEGRDEEAMTLVSRFLSVVAWGFRSSLRFHAGWGAPGKPARIPLNDLHMVSGATDYLVKWSTPREPRQRLALALYREAKSIESIPYQFLGFYKVINTLASSGAQQQEWIRTALPKLVPNIVRERIDALEAEGVDVAEHLYLACRCAVAHAYSEPLVDPDNVSDLRALSKDLFLIEELAIHAITHDLGLERFFYDERAR